MATNIKSIERGIIFLMAEWSGQAKWSHKQLTEFLKQRQIAPEHFICIDVDHEPDIYDLPELSGKIHGFGEAVVVRDGRIVFVTTLGKDKSQINERFEELFRFYQA